MTHTRQGVLVACFRFLRILFSVYVAMVAAVVVASVLFNSSEGHLSYRAAAGLFSLMWFRPYTTYFLLTATCAFFALDRAALRWRMPVWPVFAVAAFSAAAFGAFGWGQPFWMYSLAMFMVVYWVLTGRVAGRPGWSLRNFRATDWDEKVYALFWAIVFVLPTMWSAGPTLMAAALPVQPGTPAYQTAHPKDVTVSLKRALRRFPNSQSCLENAAISDIRADLVRMDWDRIDTTHEAKVCVFRLLHEWGDVNEAAGWFEAQGFRAGEPRQLSDGRVYVNGSWSIRKNGPKFFRTGFLGTGRITFAYGMNVSAKFSPDGQDLLSISIDFSVL